jgi:hypothetical protein
MRHAALPIVLLLMAASVAPADTILRDRVIADARTQTQGALVFERNTHVVEAGGGTRSETRRIDRWDGRGWTLVSVNGKPPRAADLRSHTKSSKGEPVPGYHRLAVLLNATTERRVDTEGRTILSIAQLPPGTVISDGVDISAHLKAEAYVATGRNPPWVQQLRMSARESFKLGWIKVLTFDLTSDYKLDQAGTPRLVSQTADSQGTFLGIAGGQKSETSYIYP